MSDEQSDKSDGISLHRRDKSHIKLSYITHFYFDQESGDSLSDLLRIYENYDPALLDVIQFVIVDDGSPLEMEIPDFDLNITWLRITEDIPWNQAGSRNLGAVHAKSDKIILTDLDLVFPEKTLWGIVNSRNPGRYFYKFHKFDKATGKKTRSHPNTFFISRSRFLRHFGCDEEFAGNYGYEDLWFVKYQKYHGSWQRHLPKKYFCHDRVDIDRDSKYHSLVRDQNLNRELYLRKRRESNLWGPESGHSRIFLNFTWKIVKEIFRESEVTRPERKIWKHLWWFRTFFNTYR